MELPAGRSPRSVVIDGGVIRYDAGNRAARRRRDGRLSDVRALAGFVTDGSRAQFSFTVVGNSLDPAWIDAVIRPQNEIALSSPTCCDRSP